MIKFKVIVADDHETTRRGMRSILEQSGCEVIAEAKDGREAVDKVRSLRPDVVVMDISMPSLNGLEATQQMLQYDPQTRVLIFTMHQSDSLIHEVLKSGARGYLLKSDAGRDLVTAVNVIWSNGTYFSAPRCSNIWVS